MSIPDSNSPTIYPEQKQNYKEKINQLKIINTFSTKSMASNSFRAEIIALNRSGQELLVKNVRLTFFSKFPYFSMNFEHIGQFMTIILGTRFYIVTFINSSKTLFSKRI